MENHTRVKKGSYSNNNKNSYKDNNYRGGYNNNYNNSYNNNYNNNYKNYGGNYNKQANNWDKNSSSSYTKNTKTAENKVMPTKEEGFTGNTENWFSDEEFYKNLLTKNNAEAKDYYFNSYSSFYIHEEMIKDSARTGAYRSAIMNNKEAFKDKVVLDIGCGTGILSIFAARAGAKHVYGLEYAHIADYAKQIVKDNGLEDKITIIKGKVEDVTLPVDTVDIIISEWMGYFLLYESMLDTVLYARDKWLVKDGSGYILPDRCSINMAALEDVDYKRKKLEFWDGVGYDINMKCMRPAVLCEPIIDVLKSDYIISNNCRIFEIDLYTCKKEDLDFTASYELTFSRNDTLSGLICWFETPFSKLPNPANLSTSPYLKATHWKQTSFYTEKDISVNKGDVLKGSIAVRKSKSNFRELDVKISYHLQGVFNSHDFTQQYKIR